MMKSGDLSRCSKHDGFRAQDDGGSSKRDAEDAQSIRRVKTEYHLERP